VESGNADHNKGVFISNSSPGGGQESTAIASLSTLAHHGIIYVPLGYKVAFGQLTNISETHGGSPWGAGTFAVSTTSQYYGPEAKYRLGCGRVPPAQ
jgi:NAD(P)H dehydrogenase (quinone)